MYKVDLEKAEEPEIKLPTSAGSSQKYALEKEMTTYSCILAWRIPGTGEPDWAAVYGVTQSQTRVK